MGPMYTGYISITCICGEGTQNHMIFSTREHIRSALHQLNADFAPPSADLDYFHNTKEEHDRIKREIDTYCDKLPLECSLGELVRVLRNDMFSLESEVYRLYFDKVFPVAFGAKFHIHPAPFGRIYQIVTRSLGAHAMQAWYPEEEDGTPLSADIHLGQILCEEDL